MPGSGIVLKHTHIAVRSSVFATRKMVWYMSGEGQKHLVRLRVADFWTGFCVLQSRFDPWVVLGGQEQPVPAIFSWMWGGPGVGAGSKQIYL